MVQNLSRKSAGALDFMAAEDSVILHVLSVNDA